MTQRQQPAVRVELADGGTATLRPLRHGEVAPVLEVFAGMSELSRSRRFLTGMARLPAMMLTALTDVDGCDRVAWVASVDGCAVDIGRYARPDPDTVAPDNTRSLRVLRALGLTPHLDDGLLEGTGRLRLPEPARVRRSTLIARARREIYPSSASTSCA